jgi:cyclohexadieny/prephenate dehydrogenase
MGSRELCRWQFVGFNCFLRWFIKGNASTLEIPPFQRIAVVGAGLIGGSVLLAGARRGLAAGFSCWSRSEASRRLLADLGVATVHAQVEDCVRGADLVVVATPVDRIEETFAAIAPALAPGALVTDAGSVKVAILRAAGRLPASVTFVGAHPMAGSEKAGAAHASAELYAGRACFITPTGAEPRAAVDRVTAFWRGLGCRTSECTAEHHDEIVAAISHVPHAAASALMLAVGDQPGFRVDAAGSGLRDATRIAAGEENLWLGILLANAPHVVDGLRSLEARVAELRGAVERGDAATVNRLLAEARVARQSLDRPA